MLRACASVSNSIIRRPATTKGMTGWSTPSRSRAASIGLSIGLGAASRSSRLRAPEADLTSVADYLMLQPGGRHVYHAGVRLRPERLRHPRPLRTDERNLLDHLLAVDDPRVAPLREQAKHVLVEDDCGLPFRLDLVVARDAAPPAQDLMRQEAAISVTSIRLDDDAVTASLWLDGDYLSAIEIDWFVNEPIQLPAPNELQASHLA